MGPGWRGAAGQVTWRLGAEMMTDDSMMKKRGQAGRRADGRETWALSAHWTDRACLGARVLPFLLLVAGADVPWQAVDPARHNMPWLGGRWESLAMAVRPVPLVG